jgi:hypothetical protein
VTEDAPHLYETWVGMGGEGIVLKHCSGNAEGPARLVSIILLLVQAKQRLRRDNHDVQWHHEQLASQAEIIARRVRLASSLIVILGVVAFSAGVAQAIDCMDRFPKGRFGIAPSHPAVAKLVADGFSPLYVVKQPIKISRKEDCQYVYTGDVFRMVETRVVDSLLAGCVGDFDGDGRADFALLMKRQRDGVVVPFVFQSRGSRYRATVIEGITDPQGFAQDKSVWPGPFCTPKPANGVFKSWVDDDTVNVVGDLFTIGWKTYFWNPKVGRFDGIFTAD